CPRRPCRTLLTLWACPALWCHQRRSEERRVGKANSRRRRCDVCAQLECHHIIRYIARAGIECVPEREARPSLARRSLWPRCTLRTRCSGQPNRTLRTGISLRTLCSSRSGCARKHDRSLRTPGSRIPPRALRPLCPRRPCRTLLALWACPALWCHQRPCRTYPRLPANRRRPRCDVRAPLECHHIIRYIARAGIECVPEREARPI